jgi:hypothetical protein
MRDEQRRNQDEPEAGFEEALADLFGEDAPGEAVLPVEPPSEPAVVRPPAKLAQPEPLVMPPSRPVTTPVPPPPAEPVGSPRPGGRSLRRIGCIAMSAVVGAIVLCAVILMVIGFIVGDPATPTPAL